MQLEQTPSVLKFVRYFKEAVIIMKWLVRLLAFGLALFLGLAGAWIGLLLTYRPALPDVSESVSWNDEELSSPALSPSGITVAYAGLHSDQEGSLYLRFIVHNGLFRPVTYGAHSAERPFARLMTNGEELPGLGRCGTGIKTFYILPGGSAEFHVSTYEFLKRPPKNDSITVGFHLRPAFAEQYGPYYSTPFYLPEEFRQAIKERNFDYQE
ncbi:MAG: hypothetical protein ABL959_16655 [Pyrinomonadaceae bacterium]